MIRLTSLANKYERRGLRVLYSNTQATPYDAQLDPNFDRTAGALSGANAITGAKSAILPGQVAIKKAGEVVTVAGAWAASTAQFRPFGLFANFVGGELSDFPTDFDRVGVWRGVNSVYEVLAPAFDDTNLATDSTDEDGTAANEVYMVSNAKGQLSSEDTDADPAYLVNAAGRLMTRLSSEAIVVELLV